MFALGSNSSHQILTARELTFLTSRLYTNSKVQAFTPGCLPPSSLSPYFSLCFTDIQPEASTKYLLLTHICYVTSSVQTCSCLTSKILLPKDKREAGLHGYRVWVPCVIRWQLWQISEMNLFLMSLMDRSHKSTYFVHWEWKVSEIPEGKEGLSEANSGCGVVTVEVSEKNKKYQESSGACVRSHRWQAPHQATHMQVS